MVRCPRRAQRVAVEATKGGVVILIALMGCGLGVSVQTVQNPGVSAERAGDQHAASGPEAQLDRLSAKHQCSPTGFGPDVVPGSALVLRNEHVRHVSFDAGWAVYTGKASGTLLALCKVTV